MSFRIFKARANQIISGYRELGQSELISLFWFMSSHLGRVSFSIHISDKTEVRLTVWLICAAQRFVVSL